jgi:hypothetical protein
MSEFEFEQPRGTVKKIPSKVRVVSSNKVQPTRTDSATSRLISKATESAARAKFTVPNKSGIDSKLDINIQLDKLKKETVLKVLGGKKPIGVSAEAIQQHLFPAPSWLRQRPKVRIELFFTIGPDRLLDTYSLRAHLLPNEAWHARETVRIDIKSYDPAAFTAIAASINASCYLASAWSRLEAGTSWYLVLRHRTTNKPKLPSNTGHNLEFNIDAIRSKRESEDIWEWSFSADSQTLDARGKVTGGRHRSGKDPRQILLIAKLLPSATYRLKPPPRILLEE